MDKLKPEDIDLEDVDEEKTSTTRNDDENVSSMQSSSEQAVIAEDGIHSPSSMMTTEDHPRPSKSSEKLQEISLIFNVMIRERYVEGRKIVGLQKDELQVLIERLGWGLTIPEVVSMLRKLASIFGIDIHEVNWEVGKKDVTWFIPVIKRELEGYDFSPFAGDEYVVFALVLYLFHKSKDGFFTKKDLERVITRLKPKRKKKGTLSVHKAMEILQDLELKGVVWRTRESSRTYTLAPLGLALMDASDQDEIISYIDSVLMEQERPLAATEHFNAS